eukprot:g1608.t1
MKCFETLKRGLSQKNCCHGLHYTGALDIGTGGYKGFSCLVLWHKRNDPENEAAIAMARATPEVRWEDMALCQHLRGNLSNDDSLGDITVMHEIEKERDNILHERSEREEMETASNSLQPERMSSDSFSDQIDVSSSSSSPNLDPPPMPPPSVTSDDSRTSLDSLDIYPDSEDEISLHQEEMKANIRWFQEIRMEGQKGDKFGPLSAQGKYATNENLCRFRVGLWKRDVEEKKENGDLFMFGKKVEPIVAELLEEDNTLRVTILQLQQKLFQLCEVGVTLTDAGFYTLDLIIEVLAQTAIVSHIQEVKMGKMLCGQCNHLEDREKRKQCCEGKLQLVQEDDASSSEKELKTKPLDVEDDIGVCTYVSEADRLKKEEEARVNLRGGHGDPPSPVKFDDKPIEDELHRPIAQHISIDNEFDSSDAVVVKKHNDYEEIIKQRLDDSDAPPDISPDVSPDIKQRREGVPFNEVMRRTDSSSRRLLMEDDDTPLLFSNTDYFTNAYVFKDLKMQAEADEEKMNETLDQITNANDEDYLNISKNLKIQRFHLKPPVQKYEPPSNSSVDDDDTVRQFLTDKLYANDEYCTARLEGFCPKLFNGNAPTDSTCNVCKVMMRRVYLASKRSQIEDFGHFALFMNKDSMLHRLLDCDKLFGTCSSNDIDTQLSHDESSEEDSPDEDTHSQVYQCKKLKDRFQSDLLDRIESMKRGTKMRFFLESTMELLRHNKNGDELKSWDSNFENSTLPKVANEAIVDVKKPSEPSKLIDFLMAQFLARRFCSSLKCCEEEIVLDIDNETTIDETVTSLEAAELVMKLLIGYNNSQGNIGFDEDVLEDESDSRNPLLIPFGPPPEHRRALTPISARRADVSLTLPSDDSSFSFSDSIGSRENISKSGDKTSILFVEEEVEARMGYRPLPRDFMEPQPLCKAESWVWTDQIEKDCNPEGESRKTQEKPETEKELKKRRKAVNRKRIHGLGFVKEIKDSSGKSFQPKQWTPEKCDDDDYTCHTERRGVTFVDDYNFTMKAKKTAYLCTSCIEFVRFYLYDLQSLAKEEKDDFHLRRVNPSDKLALREPGECIACSLSSNTECSRMPLLPAFRGASTFPSEMETTKCDLQYLGTSRWGYDEDRYSVFGEDRTFTKMKKDGSRGLFNMNGQIDVEYRRDQERQLSGMLHEDEDMRGFDRSSAILKWPTPQCRSHACERIGRILQKQRILSSARAFLLSSDVGKNLSRMYRRWTRLEFNKDETDDRICGFQDLHEHAAAFVCTAKTCCDFKDERSQDFADGLSQQMFFQPDDEIESSNLYSKVCGEANEYGLWQAEIEYRTKRMLIAQDFSKFVTIQHKVDDLDMAIKKCRNSKSPESILAMLKFCSVRKRVNKDDELCKNSPAIHHFRCKDPGMFRDMPECQKGKGSESLFLDSDADAVVLSTTETLSSPRSDGGGRGSYSLSMESESEMPSPVSSSGGDAESRGSLSPRSLKSSSSDSDSDDLSSVSSLKSVKVKTARHFLLPDELSLEMFENFCKAFAEEKVRDRQQDGLFSRTGHQTRKCEEKCRNWVTRSIEEYSTCVEEKKEKLEARHSGSTDLNTDIDDVLDTVSPKEYLEAAQDVYNKLWEYAKKGKTEDVLHPCIAETPNFFSDFHVTKMKGRPKGKVQFSKVYELEKKDLDQARQMKARLIDYSQQSNMYSLDVLVHDPTPDDPVLVSYLDPDPNIPDESRKILGYGKIVNFHASEDVDRREVEIEDIKTQQTFRTNGKFLKIYNTCGVGGAFDGDGKKRNFCRCLFKHTIIQSRTKHLNEDWESNQNRYVMKMGSLLPSTAYAQAFESLYKSLWEAARKEKQEVLLDPCVADKFPGETVGTTKDILHHFTVTGGRRDDDGNLYGFVEFKAVADQDSQKKMIKVKAELNALSEASVAAGSPMLLTKSTKQNPRFVFFTQFENPEILSHGYKSIIGKGRLSEKSTGYDNVEEFKTSYINYQMKNDRKVEVIINKERGEFSVTMDAESLRFFNECGSTADGRKKNFCHCLLRTKILPWKKTGKFKYDPEKSGKELKDYSPEELNDVIAG